MMSASIPCRAGLGPMIGVKMSLDGASSAVEGRTHFEHASEILAET